MRHTCCLLCLVAGLSVGRAAPPKIAEADEKRLLAAGLKTDGQALLEFFRKRTVQAGPDRVRLLIKDLGARSFNTRERASKELIALGARSVPDLQKALESTDAEVRRRAENGLQAIKNAADPALVAAVARALVVRKPTGAAGVLIEFLPGVLDAAARDALLAAVADVGIQDGKADPAVLRALEDREPLCRAAAATALARSGVKELLARVRPLLEDRDPLVRLHVSLALVRQGERAAVPVLIGLFDGLPRTQLVHAEDLLYRLAGDRAPSVALGSDAKSRRAFRDAWLAWWRTTGAKTDLAVLKKTGFQDHTLIVLLDEGQIIELDPDDKVRFRIKEVAFPLDVQYLPGERILVAEYGGNKVTERLRDGTVLWEVKADGPLVAQRLPNGNTFIVCKTHLSEVDRNGREVFWYARPQGEDFMRARKLPDGGIACVTNRQLFLRLTPEGKEVARFPVQVHTFGGRLAVLPNGNVLIPQMYQNKVIEYDGEGKVVRDFSVSEPIVATRLPNGNTLVTSMSEKRAVEFDLAGKMVWEYKADTRVTRAYRR
jgi:HEAT repeat protein